MDCRDIFNFYTKINPFDYYKVPNTDAGNISLGLQLIPGNDDEIYYHGASSASPRINYEDNEKYQPTLQINDNLEESLITQLKTYTINPYSLRAFGFPTECEVNPSQTYILKSVPGLTGDDTAAQKTFQKECVRCRREFVVTRNGHYLTQENCTFHIGKCSREVRHGISTMKYTCCGRDKYSSGCMLQDRHVWSGISVGLNGPFYDYVKTRPKSAMQCMNVDANVFVLDCEMCYTAKGLECTELSVLNWHGELIYSTLVRPELEILDYNTQYSGLTEEHFSIENNDNIKTLQEVQNDLLEFISADTILIGHGLENDLRALKIIHKTIIDTSILYQHECGFPFKHSLRNLTKTFLKRKIQTNDMGHDSIEDCQATLDLVLTKAWADFDKMKNYNNFNLMNKNVYA